MRPFMHLFLFIFAPGNALLKIGECGGKINGFWDTGGSIQYPSHPDQSTHNISCTWIIDSRVNQTVSIEVISLGNGSLGVRFGNEKEQSYTTDEPALFSGKGRTIVQWINVETSGALHLRWNTSDTSHDPGLITYTHSDANPGSPSLSGSNGVTYTPDIPERTHTPITHTPRGESAQQRRSISDPADKSRPLFPQENTNNEQETTGKGISDLSVVGTNSYSHTHSRTGANFASNTHEPFIAWASNAIQSSPPLRTTPKQSSDVKTNTLSHLDTNAVTQRTESSQRMDAFTRTVSNTLRAKRGDPSLFATASFLSAISHVRDTSLYNNNLKQKDFPTDHPDIEEGTTFLGNLERSHRNWESSVIPHDNRPVSSETDRTGLSMSTYPNVNITNPHTNINADLISTSATSVLSKFPLVNQSNPLVFTESNITKYTKSSNSTSGIIEPPMNVSTVSMTDNDTTNLSVTEGMPSKSSKASTIQISHTVPRDDNKSTQQTNSASASISETKMNDFTSHHDEISISTAFTLTTSSDWIPASTPDGDTRIHISNVASTVRQNEERQRSEGSLITTPLSIHSSGSVSPPANPIMTSDLPVVNINTVRFESRTVLKELDIFTIPVQNTNTLTSSRQEMLSNTPQVHAYQTSQYSTPSPLENTQTNADFSVSSGNERPHSEATRGLSPFSNVPTETTENRESITTHITASPLMSSPDDITSTQISVFSTPLSMTTPKAAQPPSQTTNQAKRSAHGTSTESPAVQVHSHIPNSSTIIPPKHMTTGLHVTWTNNLKQGVTHPSQIQSTSSKSDIKRTHVRHFFIIEDQPAIIKENTFQVLLQITLEKDFDPGTRLLEIEPFLQRVSGYQSQHVTWHNGPVLQTVVGFQTLKALPWLGRAESLLQEVGLNPLPGTGLFVGGVRVKNMTVGLQTDVCDRLFECPSGFQCVSSKNNASCSSVCHFDYCKHQGICVHRPDQQPLCQCPVGEDYWFMGRRCDLRMTRPRLVGVCFGVLIAVAAVMALLSYLTVQRFKSMLMQAKVEQTRSSYRRFNHFDELSARFWGRSWPGSEDSLDNPVFTRSDEILHLRALDRTCCYHDDTLSVVSTYHGSGTHLNTIYPHSSQYGWDLSNCSLADGVVDSGKASDLSVCSWPIEPIQWTPFPLLQQLNKNTTTAKVSRPRSYCEGMELVDLEKSWTA